MSNKEAASVIRDFLMDKRALDSEVYEAIRVQYLASSQNEEVKAA